MNPSPAKLPKKGIDPRVHKVNFDVRIDGALLSHSSGDSLRRIRDGDDHRKECSQIGKMREAAGARRADCWL